MDLNLIIGLAIFFFLLGLVVGYLAFTGGRAKNTAKDKTEKSSEEIHAKPLAHTDLVRVYLESSTNSVVVETQQGKQKIPFDLLHTEKQMVSAKVVAPLDENITHVQSYSDSSNQVSSNQALNSQENQVTQQSTRFINTLSAALRGKPIQRTQVDNVSIALQIDRILQEQLSEAQLKRGLQLVQMPDQSMGIRLDNITYDSIESVPDDEIKNLIRTAVAEWSRQQGVNR